MQNQLPASKSSLIGTVVKTLHLKPYKAKSIKDAIRLGKYDSIDNNIVTLFAKDEVSLAEAVSVDLVKFDRHWLYDEILAWHEENKRQPILPKHLYAIGIQHPEEQRTLWIVEPGSVQRGRILYLNGHASWRGLCRETVNNKDRWFRLSLVGFLSK